MHFINTPLEGVYLIETEKREDERGFFSRIFCKDEFAKHGIESQFVQVNNSLSLKKGTLRGMHYQAPPKGEAKLIRCIQGAFYDVALDLRPESKTFGISFGVEISAKNRKMVYVPAGFAHGFLTLQDHTEVLYFVSEMYAPEFEKGVRFDDPQFNIQWPFSPVVISDKDKNLPGFYTESI